MIPQDYVDFPARVLLEWANVVHSTATENLGFVPKAGGDVSLKGRYWCFTACVSLQQIM